MVQTVSGEVPADSLGFTLMHEHVFHDMYEITLSSNMILSDANVARSELQAYKDAGGHTLVDQTVHGLNPSPSALRDVANEVGINIIAGTGFYWERFYPEWCRSMSEIELTRVMVGDLQRGILGTDVRAGIIGEIGSGHRAISLAEARVFRACAAAQREVGVPIATHALFTRIGLDQVECLEAAGADLDHVLIGHADTTPDLGYHVELLSRGVWIGYDSIGQLDKQSDEARATAIVELARLGHLERILISSDVGKRQALGAFGGKGYGHVIVNFLPLLREAGMSEQDIRQLTTVNPRNFFSY